MNSGRRLRKIQYMEGLKAEQKLYKPPTSSGGESRGVVLLQLREFGADDDSKEVTCILPVYSHMLVSKISDNKMILHCQSLAIGMKTPY